VSRILRIAMAQINVTVGAVAENVDLIRRHLDLAAEAGAHVAMFPELAIPGYPPEDLLFHPRFVAEAERGLERVAAHCPDLTAVVGTVVPAPGGRLHNAAAVLHGGEVRDVYHKVNLPNYGVFDEHRYFVPGARLPVYLLGDVRIGVSVCEDLWAPDGPPYLQAVCGGAEVLININASPYHEGKREEREHLVIEHARRGGAFVCYNNLIGGQDELVFDGQGLVAAPDGTVIAHGPAFREALIVADLDLSLVPAGRKAPDPPPPGHDRVAELRLTDSAPTPPTEPVAPMRVPPLDRLEEIRQALVTGTRDYLGKNGFSAAVVGLSGGIDSALVAELAVEALGPDNVTCVFMPSRFSSPESRRDAEALCASIGVRLLTLPIDGLFAAYLALLKGVLGDRPADETEENLQSRIRGNLLMALSNKFGYLVLTTGNKSEMSVGYATLYGDMAGGFAVIKDLPKEVVFALAAHINATAGREVIPRAIIDKPPTAELRENQLDTDSLPPYEVLDPILAAYVQDNRAIDEIVAAGFERETVARVLRMVDLAEYKRRQAPPGIRITPRAFGRDRRMPITNRFRET
jgi:NAD+ synthase (glutamine-hydrolysing)